MGRGLGVPDEDRRGPDTAPLSGADRVRAGRDAVKDIVGKVWPYVLAGIAVGAGIHGYVPRTSWLDHGQGRVVVGTAGGPDRRAHVLQCGWHHSRGAALLGKGAALGTVLAFMMSVIGLSLPE